MPLKYWNHPPSHPIRSGLKYSHSFHMTSHYNAIHFTVPVLKLLDYMCLARLHVAVATNVTTPYNFVTQKPMLRGFSHWDFAFVQLNECLTQTAAGRGRRSSFLLVIGMLYQEVSGIQCLPACGMGGYIYRTCHQLREANTNRDSPHLMPNAL